MSNVENKPVTTESNPDNVRPLARWSAQRKCQAVLRLLRGESLDSVSRSVGVDIDKLETWRRDALAGIQSGLQRRTEMDSNKELQEALHRVGELSMENELLRRRCGLARPSRTRRSKQ
jgi:transposase